MSEEKEKFTIKTSKKLTVPTDKLSFNPFRIPRDKFEKSLEKGIAFTEKVIGGEKIQTKYFLTLLDSYGELTPLNFFDRCTLMCCISAQQAGEKAVTTDVIFRMLTGKTRNEMYATEKMKNAIFNSVKRLMSTTLTADMATTCQKLKYNGGKWKDFTAPLLPCCVVRGTVNGKDVDVITFYDKSPLLRVVTEIKTKQIISYSTEPLNAPKIHNTQDNICLKNYVLYQIELMKCGRRDNKTLKFDSIVETCGIDVNKDRNKRHDVKQVVLKFLEHLKTIGEIKNYCPVSDGDLKNPVTNNQQKFHGFKIEI